MGGSDLILLIPTLLPPAKAEVTRSVLYGRYCTPHGRSSKYSLARPCNIIDINNNTIGIKNYCITIYGIKIN